MAIGLWGANLVYSEPRLYHLTHLSSSELSCELSSQFSGGVGGWTAAVKRKGCHPWGDQTKHSVCTEILLLGGLLPNYLFPFFCLKTVKQKLFHRIHFPLKTWEVLPTRGWKERSSCERNNCSLGRFFFSPKKILYCRKSSLSTSFSPKKLSFYSLWIQMQYRRLRHFKIH